MLNTKINTADLQRLKRKFSKLQGYSKKVATYEMNRAVLQAQALAVAAAPVAKSTKTAGGYGSTLKGSIQIKPFPEGAEMYSTANYAPYVEFGTGSRYVSPNDATKLGIPESYIAQFKGKGIKDINLAPRPFFYVSAARAYNNMLARVENRLKKILNE